MNFDDILGTSATPDAVPDEPDALTVKECDTRLATLAALAPGFSFSTRATVVARAQRTRVPRSQKVRMLQTTMNLQLREYDREAKVSAIDEQWLTLRAHRHLLMRVARRKRPRDDEEQDEEQEESHRRVRRRHYETATDCAVCQEPLYDDEDITDLPCRHQLHTTCLAGLNDNNIYNCPTCRAPLRSSSVDSISSQVRRMD